MVKVVKEILITFTTAMLLIGLVLGAVAYVEGSLGTAVPQQVADKLTKANDMQKCVVSISEQTFPRIMLAENHLLVTNGMLRAMSEAELAYGLAKVMVNFKEFPENALAKKVIDWFDITAWQTEELYSDLLAVDMLIRAGYPPTASLSFNDKYQAMHRTSLGFISQIALERYIKLVGGN